MPEKKFEAAMVKTMIHDVVAIDRTPSIESWNQHREQTTNTRDKRGQGDSESSWIHNSGYLHKGTYFPFSNMALSALLEQPITDVSIPSRPEQKNV